MMVTGEWIRRKLLPFFPSDRSLNLIPPFTYFPGAFQERHRLRGRRVPAAERGRRGGVAGRARRGQHAVAVQEGAEEADGRGTPGRGARRAGMTDDDASRRQSARV